MDIMFVIVLSMCVAYVLYKLNKRPQKLLTQKENAVLITGCDSGIGYSLACYCHELGMTVFAGCLSENSSGSNHLRKLENVYIVEVDVCNIQSIQNATTIIHNILEENPSIVLKTLVNNAGIMVFGEFAWQTVGQIQHQINVNLIGAMNVTSMFLSYIVQNKGRIINICSHCSLEALPGLSVYAASKAALLAWSNALRIELKKFQVPVISFIPGSFFVETNILSKQKEYTREMQENMSKNNWNFYKSYFLEYNKYLDGFGQSKLMKIQNRYLYSLFNDALLNKKPNAHYCNWPPRYWIYHFLFKIAPLPIRDQLVLKFVNMPEWKH